MRIFLFTIMFARSSFCFADGASEIAKICEANVDQKTKNKKAVCACVGRNLIATGHYGASVIKLYGDWMSGKIDEKKANNNPNFLYLSMASEVEYKCAKDPKYKLDRNHH